MKEFTRLLFLVSVQRAKEIRMAWTRYHCLSTAPLTGRDWWWGASPAGAPLVPGEGWLCDVHWPDDVLETSRSQHNRPPHDNRRKLVLVLTRGQHPCWPLPPGLTNSWLNDHSLTVALRLSYLWRVKSEYHNCDCVLDHSTPASHRVSQAIKDAPRHLMVFRRTAIQTGSVKGNDEPPYSLQHGGTHTHAHRHHYACAHPTHPESRDMGNIAPAPFLSPPPPLLRQWDGETSPHSRSLSGE